ncbi:MAG TPA: GGDEF domain-containing protein [Acidiferrobacterales bacterium]|nr:GGDEF domain-containing protein [Acidiferrobacterales bacterium]
MADRQVEPQARMFNLDGNAALQAPGAALQVTALLQTTLDIEKVIELFARELGKNIPYDSFTYLHAGKGLRYSTGALARHSTGYRLLLEERLLGEVSLTRAQRFSDAEIISIENFIGGLVYALRNALLYREALESALRDPLTGVANRAALDAALKREISLSRRHKLPLSVLLLDIDKFKNINDTYGHTTGDAVLQVLTHGVNACIRTSDVQARYGGEEFVVVLPGTDRDGALLLAARIRRHIETLSCETPLASGAAALRFTVSVGVATFDGKEDSAGLVHRADVAMYAAKQLGGNQVTSL